MDILQVAVLCCLLSGVTAACDNTCDVCQTGSGNKCATCKAGYYNSNGACYNCPSGCAFCTSSSTCDSCGTGYYRYQYQPGLYGCAKCATNCDSCTSYSCDVCKAGYYRIWQQHLSGYICNQCSTYCAICTSYPSCITCKDRFFLDSSSQCSLCNPPCKHCTTATLCTQCHSGYHLTSGTCLQCPEGQYYDQTNQCSNCFSPCKACTTTSTNCTKCHSGLGLSGGTCVTCSEGSYLDQNGHCSVCSSTCKACTTTSTTCTKCHSGLGLSGGTCVTCQEGQYVDQSGHCSPCSPQCSACTTSTTCTKCQIGYGLSGSSCVQCRDGTYQDVDGKCSGSCSNNCKACIGGANQCNKCHNGQYLDEYTCTPCSAECQECTASTTCTKCHPGYGLSGSSCVQCPDGKYQSEDGTCSETCSSECRACIGSASNCTKCDSRYYVEGSTCETCSSQCKECVNTQTTCTACNSGQYVSGSTCVPCHESCSECSGQSTCSSCNDGYYKSGGSCAQCNTTCSNCTAYNDCTGCTHGYYLMNQQCHQCPQECETCSSSDICESCKENYHLELNQCVSNVICSEQCKNQQCDSGGNCINGCGDDDRYGPKCEQSCTETFPRCTKCNMGVIPVVCTECESGFVPESGDGGCKSECEIDPNCNEGVTQPHAGDGGSNTAAVAGGAAGGVVVLVAVVVVLFLVIRRRRQPPTSSKGGHHVTSPDHVYANPATGDILADRRKSDGPEHVAMEVNGHASNGRLSKKSNRPVSAKSDVEIEIDELDESRNLQIAPTPSPAVDTYYNTASLARSRVAVDKLQEYVSKKKEDDFVNEFQKLPDGLTRPYNAAMQNKDKNRYQKIYPYDVSRVVLESGPSDYINASYIDGYSQRMSYIASLGPTSKTMGDYSCFWTMVWQEKVEIIVMLTNLMEGGAMKCEQYWPDSGSSGVYGDVTVTCHSEDVYAEYVVRGFSVKKSTERRSLHHIHYTAWPDKGVPDDVTGLIEFRQRVITCPMTLGGPTLVHCSAGVGRTGTYIALDILTQEGQAEKAVDVFGCVSTMRGQRVFMVQTAAQYEYLHNAVVHALTFDCDPIKAANVRTLLSPSSSSLLQRQFEHLNQTKNEMPEAEQKAIAENKALQTKNRPGADIPGSKYKGTKALQHDIVPVAISLLAGPEHVHDSSNVSGLRHRPYLHFFLKPGSANYNYVNAVFVNSFKAKNRYIVAQTPLPTTLTDFLTLIMQSNCSCIVCLDEDDVTDKTVGVYLPALNETSKHGVFEVKCETQDTTAQYVLRKITVSVQGRQGIQDRSLYHFQCTLWGKKAKIPSDPMAFLQLTRDVERMTEGSDSIVVHCMTGAERSGLFCVVSVLMQKMEIEQQVSVVNTVRQVKARRRNAIPSKEQYRFCHQCLASYIQSFDTYSNFAM